MPEKVTFDGSVNYVGTWFESIYRDKVVSTKLTASEKDRLSEMRRSFRMRSNAQFIRFALAFTDGMMQMAKLAPPTVEQQKNFLAAMHGFAQSMPDDAPPEQVEEFLGEQMELYLEGRDCPPEPYAEV